MTGDDPESPETLEHQLARIGKVLTLGQLTPGVIHEINNPLFAILGLLEFLLADVEPGTKAHERLLLMQQSGLEVKDIVRSVIDFARERQDEQVELALDGVAAEAMELFRRTSVSRDIELELDADGGPFVLSANRNSLKVVFVSLFTNAQHALPRGGTVRVTVERSGADVLARISDSGTGVPADVAARMFEPFFTTRAEQGATGLGLTVSRAIARLQGGDLAYEPPLGPGARFVLRLPAASAPV